MKEKGFTLIELLGVVILLALLAVITVPAITKQVKNSKEQSYATQLKIIKSSAENYALENPIVGDSGFTQISLKTLQDNGYLDEEFMNPLTDEPFDTTMTIAIVKSDGQYEIEIYEIGGPSCTLTNNCQYGYLTGKEINFDPVNDKLCTTGDTCYTWNVLGYNDKSANILLNQLVKDSSGEKMSGTWISTWSKLASDVQTQAWQYEARLITLTELTSCPDQWKEETLLVNDSFLKGIYWTSTEVDDDNAWAIDDSTKEQLVTENLVQANKASYTMLSCAVPGGTGLCVKYHYGYRPVITVPLNIVE